jgi:hypothetical protein
MLARLGFEVVGSPRFEVVGWLLGHLGPPGFKGSPGSSTVVTVGHDGRGWRLGSASAGVSKSV